MDDGQQEESCVETEIEPSSTAFFLDFDGTLAAIVDDPRQVRVTPPTLAALESLYQITDGALAIISGRPIETLDHFLTPLKLPLSGVHGLEWRDAHGVSHRNTYDARSLEQLRDRIAAYAADHPGLVAEEKPGSVALHYRQRPDLADSCLALAQRLASKIPAAALMRGKMVVELRLGGRSKADAVSDFMAVPPFRGRKPLFVGDDVTDEDAFRLVEKMKGAGIKIGDGETAASLRLPDRDAFETWLGTVVDAFENDGTMHLKGGEILLAASDSAAGRDGRMAPVAATATSGA